MNPTLSTLLLAALGEELSVAVQENETVGAYHARIHEIVWRSKNRRTHFPVNGHWFIYTATAADVQFTCEGLD